MCITRTTATSQRWHEATDPQATSVPGWAFRAHVLHLAAATNLPWRAVTVCAGLDAAAAARLIRCRPRRGQLPVAQATALISVDAVQLSHSASLSVDARHTRTMLLALHKAGFPVHDLADFIRLSHPEVMDLLGGGAQRCTQRTEWLATAALQALGVPCPRSRRGTGRTRLRAVA